MLTELGTVIYIVFFYHFLPMLDFIPARSPRTIWSPGVSHLIINKSKQLPGTCPIILLCFLLLERILTLEKQTALLGTIDTFYATSCMHVHCVLPKRNRNFQKAQSVHNHQQQPSISSALSSLGLRQIFEPFRRLTSFSQLRDVTQSNLAHLPLFLCMSSQQGSF